ENLFLEIAPRPALVEEQREALSPRLRVFPDRLRIAERVNDLSAFDERGRTILDLLAKIDALLELLEERLRSLDECALRLVEALPVKIREAFAGLGADFQPLRRGRALNFD